MAARIAAGAARKSAIAKRCGVALIRCAQRPPRFRWITWLSPPAPLAIEKTSATVSAAMAIC
jgi:hypothetical protein